MNRTPVDLGRGYRGVAAALLLATTFTAITRPTPAAEAVIRKVKISDLDLALPQDQKTLARRLRFAVDQVCGPRYTTNLLYATRREGRGMPAGRVG